MPDYKSMYYHLAGQASIAVETLEATTQALLKITERLKKAQQATEAIFIMGGDENEPEDEPVDEN